jgi:hypothetical protein
MIDTAVAALAIAHMLAQAAPALPQLPPNSSVKPACTVAEDDKYGYSPEQPIQVGGSPVYGAARQRRYLDTLRGLEGQPVQYKRTGQSRGADGTILDAYEVTHAGLAKPVTLYLDWYHFNRQKAPRGFTCAGPFALAIPPPSSFQEFDDVRYVAMAQGETKAFAPIPLGANAATPRGVAYDKFRIFALAAREAVAKGTRLDPQNPPQPLMLQQGLVIVAYPLTCADRTVPATAIDIVAPNGTSLPKNGQAQVAGEELARMLHGASFPAGSIGLAVTLTRPRPNDTVKITYGEGACGTENNQASETFAMAPARTLDTPAALLPDGVAPPDEPVLLQVLIDLDGALQRPTYVGGPQHLFRAAADAVGRWRFDPARINGAPVAMGVLLQVRFSGAK